MALGYEQTIAGFITYKVTKEDYVISRFMNGMYEEIFMKLEKNKRLASDIKFMIDEKSILNIDENVYNIYANLYYQFSLN